DYRQLIAFLKAMGFTSLARRVGETSGTDVNAVAAEAAPAPSTPAPAAPGRTSGQGQLALGLPDSPKAAAAPRSGTVLSPNELAAKRIEALRSAKIDAVKYETIDTLDRLNQWIARAYETGTLALKTETSSLDPMRTPLCGIAFAVAPNEATYLPLGH